MHTTTDLRPGTASETSAAAGGPARGIRAGRPPSAPSPARGIRAGRPPSAPSPARGIRFEASASNYLDLLR